MVCRLRKALYGLKQAPCVWYETLYLFLQSLGLQQTESDHGVFVSQEWFIAVYGDDMLILSQNISQHKELQAVLKPRFCMTDLGEVSHYLGMAININLDKAEITIRQTEYLKKILQKFNMWNSRPISPPMEPGVGNLLFPFEESADKKTIIWY